nr:MAG TPA: putative RNA-binding protein [Caudoviricetes sp.]DAR19735.1 MAG TPA: putative RNA-binding protein [Caudoviricetes sp.]DAZ02066.1 MAG TPA: putative RNA-binding protein [Caudoviricetes sp.]
MLPHDRRMIHKQLKEEQKRGIDCEEQAKA